MEIFPILQSGSTTMRSCAVLSPAVPVSLLFTLFTAVVRAGEYKLIKEDDPAENYQYGDVPGGEVMCATTSAGPDISNVAIRGDQDGQE